MSFTVIPVFGYDKGGLNRYYKPLFLEDEAFSTLSNATVFRGRVKKRVGNSFLGRLVRSFSSLNYFPSSASPFSFNLLPNVGFITGADNANPGVVTTANPHDLTSGDEVIITGVVGAIGYNNVVFTITVVDSTSFSIGVDAAGFGVYVSGGTWVSNTSIQGVEPNAELIPNTISFTIGTVSFSDNGSGVLVSPDAGNSGFVNYSTGIATVTTTEAPSSAMTISYDYAPMLPAVTIATRYLSGINNEQAIIFDTKYAYTYFPDNFYEWIDGMQWAGDISHPYWCANYRGATDSTRLFFISNFFPTSLNPMVYTDGVTFNSFSPILSTVGGNTLLYSARILIPYYGRMLALNTYEGLDSGGAAAASQYFNRCRFSQIGSPIESDAWRSDIFGKGGFIDAPTNQEIISCGFIKNTLIVYFEASTWQLRYVGEYGLPFIWERISSDFGSSSPMATILFNDRTLNVGDKGITAANSVEVQRIDLPIPDFVFSDINNKSNGRIRVNGVRDFQKEYAYWCYPDLSNDSTFANKILVYNYRNNTFSINDDGITCLGTYQPQTGILWDSTTVFWNDAAVTWGQSTLQAEFPVIIGGTAQGFVMGIGYSTPDGQSISITAIYTATSNLYITCPNHNLTSLSIVYMDNLSFVDPVTYEPVPTDLNGVLYQVMVVDSDNLQLLKWDGDNYSSDFEYNPDLSYYVGGGTLALRPKMVVTTKDFNPYISEGNQVKTSYFDFLLGTPEAVDEDGDAAFTVQVNVNSSPAAVANMLLPQKELETSAVSPYYVPASEYAWHRFYCTCNGQFFRITMTFDDVLMNQNSTHSYSWDLYGLTLSCRPAGKNVF